MFLPEYVSVRRVDGLHYQVYADGDWGTYTATKEEIHSWLGQRGYKKQRGFPGSLEGTYRLEGQGRAA